MRMILLLGRRAPASARRGSLARRLFLVLAAMLFALMAVAGARVVTLRATVSALEQFRAETVGETQRITEVRRLLERADDAGEAFVESNDPAKGEMFAAISREIDRGFIELERAGSRRERLLATSARLTWAQAQATIDRAILLPTGGDGARLDEFHDGLDAAAALLGDELALNVAEVGDEISALRLRERFQLYASIVILFLAFVLGGLLSRRVYRSIPPRSSPWSTPRPSSAGTISPTGSTCTATTSSRGWEAPSTRWLRSCKRAGMSCNIRLSTIPSRACQTGRCSSCSWGTPSRVAAGRGPRSRYSSWTSMASRPSTTRWAIRPATRS